MLKLVVHKVSLRL